MSETLTACPNCDSASIETRQRDSMIGNGEGPKFYCRECTHAFDNPVERTPHNPHHASGLEKQLLEADADEVFG